jgi:hypothetical protein
LSSRRCPSPEAFMSPWCAVSRAPAVCRRDILLKVPKAAAKAPTMPEPFKFKTQERSGLARDSSCESLNSKPFVFKVRFRLCFGFIVVLLRF